ncbi:MAG TPA: hypothetical protein DD490_10000 [Acidobacteria bacterium]|nr:hypothetical protein [Acidobacteriota bacterium]
MTCSTFSRRLVLATASALLLPLAATATLMNADIVNTTGSVANDYHVKLESPNGKPINVGSTFEAGGNVMFNDALSSGGVSGNGTSSVTINWSGATVNQGQTVHVGAYAPEDFIIRESWWTFGGVPLVPAKTTGKLASAKFNNVNQQWVVVQIALWSDIRGTRNLGHEWIEGNGTGAYIFNATCAPIYASWSFRRPSDTQVPLEDLNPALSGFDTWTEIVELPAAGVPCATATVPHDSTR